MPTILSSLSVSYNPWFWFAGILLLRLVVVGMAWSWTIPRDAATRDVPYRRSATQYESGEPFRARQPTVSMTAR